MLRDQDDLDNLLSAHRQLLATIPGAILRLPNDLFGLRLDGIWLHVGTPDAIGAAERVYYASAA